MAFLDFLKSPHLSMRPYTVSAPHLYALLQQAHEKQFSAIKRWAVVALAFLVLAVTPSVYVWRFGVVGAGVSFAWLAFLAMDFVGRYWFMHQVTLQDVLEDGKTRFGDIGDLDTYIALTVQVGKPVSFGDLMEQERVLALDRLQTAKDDADARVADVLERMKGAALMRAEGPSDAAH